MNHALGALTPHGLQQAAEFQKAQNNAYLTPAPASGLLDTVIHRLHEAHEIVTRLEALANRIYGARPDPASAAAPCESLSQATEDLLSGLLDRLHSVAIRLEALG